ncbi:hypothetical protein [Clostridium sp. C2-6-12]|uniref:hypothetical protein n=1 Tax=Clostridium sp. C2-6-12 TaxID=2698832 RepID=UPI00136D0417|nr:hypothetical protein [Clostridium sp. C2-6-12]
MEVNINHDKSINGFSERVITVDLDEFNQISLALNLRLEYLEEKIEEYKQSEDERLKRFIPKKESEIEQLKKIIDSLQ